MHTRSPISIFFKNIYRASCVSSLCSCSPGPTTRNLSYYAFHLMVSFPQCTPQRIKFLCYIRTHLYLQYSIIRTPLVEFLFYFPTLRYLLFKPYLITRFSQCLPFLNTRPVGRIVLATSTNVGNYCLETYRIVRSSVWRLLKNKDPSNGVSIKS